MLRLYTARLAQGQSPALVQWRTKPGATLMLFSGRLGIFGGAIRPIVI
jgi:hypothetical protein